jgi:hypothetical protein
MLKVLVSGSILFSIWLPSALAQNVDKSAVAADSDATIVAQRCDEEAAQRFSQLLSETADAVGSASFDSCRRYWDVEQDKHSEVIKSKTSTPKQMKENTFLLSTWLKFTIMDAEANSIETWRRAEVDLLRPIIMKTRLQSLTPHPSK